MEHLSDLWTLLSMFYTNTGTSKIDSVEEFGLIFIFSDFTTAKSNRKENGEGVVPWASEEGLGFLC